MRAVRRLRNRNRRLSSESLVDASLFSGQIYFWSEVKTSGFSHTRAADQVRPSPTRRDPTHPRQANGNLVASQSNSHKLLSHVIFFVNIFFPGAVLTVAVITGLS